MTTYRIPREHSWAFRGEIHRVGRKVSFNLTTDADVFESVDGTLYNFEDYSIKFDPIRSDVAGLIVGALRDGVLDTFEGTSFELSDVVPDCPACGSSTVHKRMLIAEVGTAYKYVHPKCSGLVEPAIYTRDLARNIPAPGERSKAYAVSQLLRISLMVSGCGAKGFTSRAKAVDKSTADVVMELLDGTNTTLYEPYPELEDELEEILDLAKTQAPGGPWASRIKQQAHREYTSEVGVTCSMLMLLKTKRDEEAAPKGFIEAYELADLKLTLESSESTVEYWSYSPTTVTRLKFLTDDGRHLTWKTSGALGVLDGAPKGTVVILEKATLKGHSTWRGCDTTDVKRAKFRMPS